MLKKLLYRLSTLRVRVVLGFILVLLPLLYGIAEATHQIHALVNYSQQAVQENAEIMLLAASIYAETNQLERTARQYKALPEEYFSIYQKRSQQTQRSAQNLLQQVSKEKAFQQLIYDYLAAEQAVFQQLVQAVRETNMQAADLSLKQFETLSQMAQQMFTGEYIRQDSTQKLDVYGKNIIQSLFNKASILLLATILFGIWFLRTITRPLKQMEQAINRLGSGQLEQPITIQGTSDVVKLGRRLEWLRQRLNELEASKSRFIQHVSHDLKTPLTAIKEGVSLLQTDGFGHLTADQQEILHIVDNNSHRLQKLIEDLLAFQSMHLQTVRLECTPTRLDQLIQTVCERHRLAMRIHQIELKTMLQPLTLSLDAEKFSTIIDNLVSNALKYAPPASTVLVQCWQQAAEVIIQVHDSGPGIKATERPHIFAAFYQGSRAASNSVQGSGLGLAIVQHYVQAHQGQVILLDEADGTTFQIRLPSSTVDAIAVQTTQTTDTLASATAVCKTV